MIAPPTRFRTVVVVVALVAAAVLGAAAAPPARADRTVGDGPLDVLLEAAGRYHDDCATPANRLTPGQLAGLVLAPSFPETGAPPDRAPSPMTLSRWDSQSALFSYGDPSSYTRAFWHPGVGAWAWDDASLRGFSAAERIDSAFIVDFTTAFIAGRWCTSPSFSTVWAPWYACNGGTCKAIYDELVRADGTLSSVARDAAVSSRGGMRAHECRFGDGATFRCWYVDPARAEGHDDFAVPGYGPSPITDPFIVFRTSSHEYRHWLRADTGYDRDIRASLELGRNSRTDLAWATGSDLCDVTRGVGRCGPVGPVPPPGLRLQLLDVSGDYQPLAGDFDGDGYDDILWYGPGAAYDSLWLGRPSGRVTRPVVVRGTYEPFVGDFDGDGRDDVFWYGPGSDYDTMWYGTADGFRPASVRVSGVYDPVAGDFDGDGYDDVLWYGPGEDRDSRWNGTSSRGEFEQSLPLRVNGVYEPVAGDFDGDGRDDVFWYGPGSARDLVWYGTATGAFDSVGQSVSGVYQPVAGDLNGDGRSDVLWYAPGSASDSFWRGRDRSFAVVLPRPEIDAEYRVFTGDFDGGGNDEVFFHRPGPALDARWR